MLRLLPILIFAACADPETVETPFEGPGFDPVARVILPQDAPFVVAITELHVKNAPGPGGRFGDHAQAIGEHLYGPNPPEGFVGGSFRNVGKLEWWTLSVWTDEVAMTEFVLSEPHTDAMIDLGAVATDARSTHVPFPAGGAPPTWDWALDTLEEERWLLGGL